MGWIDIASIGTESSGCKVEGIHADGLQLRERLVYESNATWEPLKGLGANRDQHRESISVGGG